MKSPKTESYLTLKSYFFGGLISIDNYQIYQFFEIQTIYQYNYPYDKDMISNILTTYLCQRGGNKFKKPHRYYRIIIIIIFQEAN